ncbi:MAG: pyruvate dehydrogenase (acetyl-transferring) E1 component subunit alpha [Rhodospirillales bacterium]|nr:pyruvate dehydrogenase (acetyl-transferring) E1 component subunit alpha [Rhodospirillales bacterium]
MAQTKRKPDLHAISNSKPTPSKDDLKKFYRDMLLIRRFEEKAAQLYGMGLIGGFCHLYIGQEAVVTGITSVQDTERDSVVTTYRDHAHMLACDMDPRMVMAELTGRIDGYSRGKGGSMHMFSKEKRFFGGHGIVGACASIGTGLGFAHKYKEDGGVAIVYNGDGGANQGQVYECYNMAALWKLPILYVIENNKYAMGTSTTRHAAGELYKRGEGFGIPGEQVDGQDIFEVQRAAKQALDYIREGNGPYILEMMTYRYRGHSMSDPAKYRTKEEVSSWKDERDPIDKVKRYMLEEEGMSEDRDLKLIEKEIKQIIKETEEFAQTSPFPDESELWTDVLVSAEDQA